MPEKPNKKILTGLEKSVPETTPKIVSDEPEKQKNSENKEPTKGNKDENLRSGYYDKALAIIIKTGDTTFSNLQRKLKMPTNKAKRMLEIFEQDGILGPSIKGKPREILKKEVQIEEKENNPEKSEPAEKENQPIDIFEEAKNRLRDNINKRVDAEIEKNRKEGEEEEASKEKNIDTTTETKELSEEDKEILAVETEYNLKIKEKQDRLNELLKEEDIESKPIEGDKEAEKGKEKQEYLNKLEDAIKEGNKEKIKQIENEIYEKFVKETVQKPDTTQDNLEQPKTTPEQVLEMEKLEEFCLNAKAEFKNKLENGPLSSRLKNGVINGIDKWENYGKNEKGLKGFGKRFTKMAINMALIGAISSVSVEKLAEVGVGTASALGGSATTYLGKKMAIGLGIGSLMEIGGNKIPDKVKKWIPLIMGVGSVTASVILTAGIAAPVIVGLSSAAGYASSKLIKGNFTNEIIAKKEEEAKQKFFEKIKNESGPVDSNRLAEIKEEYLKILKKSESRKLWGKLIDDAKRLGVGSLVSSITMEASGFAHDLANNQTMQEVVKNTEPTNEVRTEKIETQENNTQNTEEQKQEAVAGEEVVKNEVETPVQTETKSEIETNTTEVKNEESSQAQPEANTSNESGDIQEFMKTSSTQDAIKLGMYNPGEENESLTVQSGTMSFDDGNGHRVEVPYSSNGAIQTIADLKVKILEEYGDISKIPSGNISTHFTDMQGVEHDQSLIQTESDGSVVVKKYEGNMFDSDNSGQKIEAPSDTQDVPSDHKIPEQINPETGLPMNESNIDTQVPGEYKVPEQINPETGLPINSSENNHQETGEDTKTINSNESSGNLSPEKLEHVQKVFDHNINYISKDIPENVWEHTEKHISAVRIMDIAERHELGKEFNDLINHMKKLEETTGVHPIKGESIGGIETVKAETIPDFFNRALKEAERIGQIDKVTL